MKAAAIYARVSTADQADNGTSLESQVVACERYAEQNGYKVLSVFRESKSGASLDRPMLDQVRELARKGDIDAVIFYALDRLSRDETDTLILAREWRARDVELKCATVPLEDTPQGQFLLTMLAAVGKLERAGILERTMRGKRQSIRGGKVLRTATAIYGYTFNEGHFEIHEPEAVWVRKVFEWYCTEGVSLMVLAHRLTDAGVPCKRGGTWNPTTVRNILTNPAYMGEYYWGREEKSSTRRKPRPRSEWVGPVKVPAIVSRAFFDAATERLEYNKVNSKRHCKADYLLRGLITCGKCGRRFTGSTYPQNSEKSKTYYRCSKQSRSVLDDLCDIPKINGYKAEEKVWAWVEEHLSHPDLIMRMLDASDEQDRQQRERDAADLRALLALQADLDREENKLIDLYTNDAISLDKFRERNKLIEERRAGIEESLGEIETRTRKREEAAANVRNVQELCEAVRRGLPRLRAQLTIDEKREILNALHVKVTALPTGDILASAIFSEDVLKLGSDNPLADTQPAAGENCIKDFNKAYWYLVPTGVL